MQPIYTRYGVQTTDPSQGMIASQNNLKANLNDVLSGITNMMRNQEAQIIQQNTQALQDQLKQRIQSEGLSVLGKPIDMESTLKPFGNMVDKAVVTKTLEDQVNLLKNQHVNAYSAEADKILAETSDPIQAREHLKQRLLAAGAPAPIADTEAGVYDLRKAAEIKNIATRKTEALDAAAADSLQAAQQGGYTAGKQRLLDAIAKLPKHEQPAAMKRLETWYEESTKPTEADEQSSNTALALFDNVTNTNLAVLRENLKQKNDQTSSTSNSKSESEGSGSGSRFSAGGGKGGKAGGDYVDDLGKRLTNWIEGLAPNNDGLRLRSIHKGIVDKVENMDDADTVLRLAFESVYSGDKTLGNNLSPAELDAIEKKTKSLIASGQYSKSGGAGRTATSTSYSKSGNISFTNSDHITKYAAERAKERQEFASKLKEAARNKRLGYTPDPNNPNPVDPITAIAMSYNTGHTTTAPPTLPATHGGKPAAATPAEKIKSAPQSKPYQQKKETSAADNLNSKVLSYAKEIEQRDKLKAAAASAKTTSPAKSVNKAEEDPEMLFTKNSSGNLLTDRKGKPRPLKMRRSEGKKLGLS